MVGHTKPYKNAPAALRAMARVTEKHRDVRLVFVGRGDNYAQLQQLAAHLGITAQILFYPQIDDIATLHALYHNAVALLQPSFTEGFGLPVIEAMQVGCPVIVANRGSLPEVAGPAGLLIDPTAPETLAHAMTQLLSTPSFRMQCIERGKTQAARFDWRATAQQTLAVYRSLHGGHQP